MKKLLCALLAALFLCGGALACEEDYTVVRFDYESTTWANDFYAFPQVGLQICVPEPLIPGELNEANTRSGIVAIFWTENGEAMYIQRRCELDYNCEPVCSLFNYYETLLERGTEMADADMLLLNSMPCFIYTDVENNERHVAFVGENGMVTSVNFSHATGHPEFAEMIAETIPGILPWSE